MKTPPRSLSVHHISISQSELPLDVQASIAERLQEYKDDLSKVCFKLNRLPQCSKVLSPLIGQAEDALYRAVAILKHHKEYVYK